MDKALQIIEKAKELGYDKCGIIPIGQMSGYTEKFPWAKAVVVCSYWYGKYRIPSNLQGRFAKYYLTDGRVNEDSDGYKTSTAFENYLREQGFRRFFLSKTI